MTDSLNSSTSASLRLLKYLAVAAAYRSTVDAFVTFPITTAFRTPTRVSHPPNRASTPLFVVADVPDKEKRKRNNSNDKDADDWVETEGGFLPKLPGLLKEKFTKPRTRPEEVLTIQEYKAVVADEKGQMVAVRFYAPWCKACKAVEQPFRKLCRENPSVKFVEVPLTKDNAFLHEGLGIPSLPYAHIYHPEAGLVEERGINKKQKKFAEFERVLMTYIEGECAVEYPEGGVCIQAAN
jgi:thiol-disulfide isomerase/thioredoxin